MRQESVSHRCVVFHIKLWNCVEVSVGRNVELPKAKWSCPRPSPKALQCPWRGKRGGPITGT